MSTRGTQALLPTLCALPCQSPGKARPDPSPIPSLSSFVCTYRWPPLPLPAALPLIIFEHQCTLDGLHLRVECRVVGWWGGGIVGEVRSDVRTMPIYQTDQNRAESLNPNPVTPTCPPRTTPSAGLTRARPPPSRTVFDWLVDCPPPMVHRHTSQGLCSATPNFSLARFTH